MARNSWESQPSGPPALKGLMALATLQMSSGCSRGNGLQTVRWRGLELTKSSVRVHVVLHCCAAWLATSPG
eukprot:8443689-Lingulodinium_polyedra.AAC.1